MKKIFTLFVLFACLANAQTKFGITAGLNMATFHGNDISNAKMRYGLASGIFLNYDLSQGFALQPELLYSMKGYTSTAGTIKTIGKYDYMEIPAIVKYSIAIESVIKPFIFVGPSASILIKSKLNTDKDYEVVSPRFFDFGALFGAGASMPLDKGEINFNIRYGLGFTTVSNQSTPTDIKNRYLGIMVGYSF